MNNTTTCEFLQALYFTLRKMKGRNFHSNDYKWLLGVEIVNEFKLGDVYAIDSLNSPMYFYDIIVEVDYKNPHIMKLRKRHMKNVVRSKVR